MGQLRHPTLINSPLKIAAGEEAGEEQPLCTRLFRQFGAYPGPGDGHVAEFFPQLMRPLIKSVEEVQGEAIRGTRQAG